VDAVLGGTPASYTDIPKLELTCRIVTETLRLYPPAWFSTRMVTTPTRLGDHTLPAGTSIAFSPFVIHHRGDLYDHPETFDPDRWSPSGFTTTRHAHIPFGGGARKCIGDTFAMIESSLILATIAARWRLEPVPGRRVRHLLGAVLRPRELVMRPVARTCGG
jgi:cytochrome P450